MTTPEPEVTQADRDAAWPFRGPAYTKADKERWDSGAFDQASPAIKAFARHRTTASQSPPTAPEGVVVVPCMGAGGHRVSWDIGPAPKLNERGMGVIASCYGTREQAEAMAAALTGREALLDNIATMMGEFVDNWPLPKKTSTALALIAKTLRTALTNPPPAQAASSAGDPLQSYEKFDGIGEHAETIETRARIGERYLECYESALSDPRIAGYTPADCPSELLLDLINGDRLSASSATVTETGDSND